MLRFNRSSLQKESAPEKVFAAAEVHPPFEVVFAVASKLGDAHVRNRIKRRLREALHTLLKTGELKRAGFDLAVVPRKETATVDFADLCADLKMALERLPKRREIDGGAAAREGAPRSAPKK